MITGYRRGHLIEYVNDDHWIYSDTREKVDDSKDRECGHCPHKITASGHDGCLGTLSGVRNACCGHGNTEEAYIQYPDGRSLSGSEAVKAMDLLRPKELKVPPPRIS